MGLQLWLRLKFGAKDGVSVRVSLKGTGKVRVRIMA